MRQLAFALILFLAGMPAKAHGPNDPPHQTFQLGDFKLENGKSIKDFTISYVTHGTLNANKTNAILMMTYIGGNHHRLDYLIGPGRALDPLEIFYHLHRRNRQWPDDVAIQQQKPAAHAVPEIQYTGHGQLAASPYERKIWHHASCDSGWRFHGGMQALQWAVSYPDMVDSIVPMIPLGRTPAWTTGFSKCCGKPSWPIREIHGWKLPANDPPEQGMRLWAGWLSGVVVRTPLLQESQLPKNLDAVG